MKKNVYKAKKVANNERLEIRITNIVLMMLGLLFFFCLGEKGVVMGADSDTYLSPISEAMSIGAMPGYVILINLVRGIVGAEQLGLYATVVQGILAIVAVMFLTKKIGRCFECNGWEHILLFVCLLAPYGYTLPEYVVTHEIMTEGVCFSLFYVFFAYLLEYLFSEGPVITIKLCLSFGILVLFRKQFVILLIPLIFGVIKKKCSKKMGIIVGYGILLISIIFIVSYLLCPSIYNFLGTSQLMYSMAGKAVYLSSADDIRLFDSQYMKDVFTKLHSFSEESGMLYSQYMGESVNRWDHIIRGTNFSTRDIWRNIHYYCIDNNLDPELFNEIINNIFHNLFVAHPLLFLSVCLQIMGQAFISSIFVKKASIYVLCEAITIIFYALSFLSYLMLKKAENETVRERTLWIVVMAVLIINVIVLSIVFQSLQRYVVYTFGLFYVCTYLNYRVLIRIEKRKRK